MFLGQRTLETNLTFYAQFINNTGAASNVDAALPTYTIYEEETAAAILAGNLTQQGGWGAGLYSEQVNLAAVAGFLAGRDYVIRITGTIDAVDPAAIHHFNIGPTDANLVQIDGATTVGTNATLNLQQLNIDNPAGDAIRAVSTGANGHGAQLVGNGSGNGLLGIGGLTGRGIDGRGGANSGEGIRGLGQGGNATGIRGEADGTGAGVLGASPAGSGFVGFGPGGQAFRADPASGAPLSQDIAEQIADQNWQEGKAGHQGETIMGNIAEDTDNMQFTGEEDT